MFLLKEIDRIERRIEAAKKNYDAWLSMHHFLIRRNTRSDNNSKFEKAAGIDKMRSELKTIKFLAADGD